MTERTLLFLAAAGLLAACGGSSSGGGGGAQQLTFRGNGGAGSPFNGPHAGHTLRAALLDGGTVLDIQKTTVAAAGVDPAFSVTFAPALDTAKAYTVHYWIDSNFGLTAPAGAGACDPKATDHQWSVAVPAGETTHTESHSGASTTDVCGTFTFPLTFTGEASFVSAHAGQTFHAALVRGGEAEPLDTATGTVAASGTPAFSVTFAPALVIDEPYSVKLWIDVDASNACEAPTTDHAWSVTVPTSLASHPTTLAYAHNTGFTNVCSFFGPPAYLTFRGSGATGAFNGPHAGQTLRAALLDGGTVLDLQKTTVAATGTDPAFSVTFTPAIDTSRAYTVHYWVDSNFGLTPPAGVGTCDPKATDHQWSVAIPAGETTHTETHSGATTTDVCGTFTFPLTFVGDATFVGIHPGDAFGAALVRGVESTALQVVGGTVAASGSPGFTVTFTPALVIGEPYSVKLYVDENASGTCNAPATDHAWSVDVPTSLASFSTTLAYAHTGTFTDVCAFFP